MKKYTPGRSRPGVATSSIRCPNILVSTIKDICQLKKIKVNSNYDPAVAKRMQHSKLVTIQVPDYLELPLKELVRLFS